MRHGDNNSLVTASGQSEQTPKTSGGCKATTTDAIEGTTPLMHFSAKSQSPDSAYRTSCERIFYGAPTEKSAR